MHVQNEAKQLILSLLSQSVSQHKYWKTTQTSDLDSFTIHKCNSGSIFVLRHRCTQKWLKQLYFIKAQLPSWIKMLCKKNEYFVDLDCGREQVWIASV